VVRIVQAGSVDNTVAWVALVDIKPFLAPSFSNCGSLQTLQRLQSSRYIFFKCNYIEATLGGALVSTVWRVLRLQMETTSSYGGMLRIVSISSQGQPTRSGPPARGLRVGLTTPYHKKNKPVTKINKKPRTWTNSLDKRPKQKKMECQKYV
jgi:hypothetical protein